RVPRRGPASRAGRGTHCPRSGPGRSADARPPCSRRHAGGGRVRGRAPGPGWVGSDARSTPARGGVTREVRTAAVVTLPGLVLAESALDLALGVLWVAALFGVLALRRRIRLAAVLVLLAAISLMVWGGRAGWFPPPTAGSYATGWVPFWGSRSSSALPEGTPRPQVTVAREKLAALSRDELRLTGSELEQRAGAVIALSRRIEPLRSLAPREAGAVEASGRRLARTLAASEFRDLEARRAAAAAHLIELDRRLGTVRDESEAASIVREADPVAMAQVSLRPVREDLASAAAAADALL